jgi:hypothetical protein
MRGENLRWGSAAVKIKPGEKKVRVEVLPKDVRVVYYEAFNQAPWHSWACVDAARNGRQPMVLRLLNQLGAEIIPIAEKVTSCEVVAVPYHPKTWAGHFQISFVCIDREKKKIGTFDWASLGRPMLGSFRLREFGFRGATLDEITGQRDAEVGLDEALAHRGNKAVDLAVARWLDTRTEELLLTPTFEPLHPFFDRGRDAYLQLKNAEKCALLEYILGEELPGEPGRDQTQLLALAEAGRMEAVKIAKESGQRAARAERATATSNARIEELERKLADLKPQFQAAQPIKATLKKALITLNRIALGERVDYNTEVREAVITVNSVNLDREHGFIVGKLGNIELHPDFYKSVDASERKEAEELINAAAKGRELFAKAKNTVDAWSLGKNGNIRASADFFKTLTGPGSKQLVDALEKGDDLFKDGRAKPAAKAEKAPAPAASPAEEAKAETPKLKLVAQEALDALKAGNEALSVGKPITEVLTARQLEIVEIKGPTRIQRVQTKDKPEIVYKDGKPVEEPNPAAGRLGLTKAAYQSVTGNIALARQIIARDPKKLSTADAAAANLRLTSFTEVLDATKASMGISNLPEIADERHVDNDRSLDFLGRATALNP